MLIWLSSLLVFVEKEDIMVLCNYVTIQALLNNNNISPIYVKLTMVLWA